MAYAEVHQDWEELKRLKERLRRLVEKVWRRVAIAANEEAPFGLTERGFLRLGHSLWVAVSRSCTREVFLFFAHLTILAIPLQQAWMPSTQLWSSASA